MADETLERESVTKKTHDLIQDFEQSQKRVEALRRELNGAECRMLNYETALAKWLIPKGANAGEQFNIWYGNRLISVVAGSERVTIREARA